MNLHASNSDRVKYVGKFCGQMLSTLAWYNILTALLYAGPFLHFVSSITRLSICLFLNILFCTSLLRLRIIMLQLLFLSSLIRVSIVALGMGSKL